jgi:D-glycero-D-manno-heptose 1,7-bisphosphate phosphatase
MTNTTLQQARGAIFLDRDGVINDAIPGGYVLTREQFRFLPRARAALAFLSKNSERRIVIVTNQPAIGKGLTTWEKVLALHAWMEEQIEEAGGRLDGIYVCDHTLEDNCACRKPKPALFQIAALGLDLDLVNPENEPQITLDLSRSVMVGDTLSDIRAARAAGIRECYRVCCGLPLEDPPALPDLYTLVGTLPEAAVAILRNERGE